MTSDQCISVTELEKNTSAIIRRSKTAGAQYIFVNNKPQAVILDIQTFESLDWDPDMLSPNEIKHYEQARSDLQGGVNISTLEELEAKYA